MNNLIIKICGIRDIDTAKRAALAGANLIGIVFDPHSPRYVQPDHAAAISHAAKKAGAAPVAVFLNHNHHEMYRICEACDIQIVQLHGEMTRAHHHFLPDHYQRIYVQTETAHAQSQIDAGLRYLDPHRDFILLDHAKPGQGQRIDWQNFHYNLAFPWLLAGGLTPTNVTNAIAALHPSGIDVSSGVESSRGNKEISLIQNFIASVRGHTHVA